MSVIIRLKNLPITAAASDVRTFFSGLKIPDGAVHIIGGDEGEVFVGFASDEDARIAMTRDRSLIHGAEIRLLLSSKSEQNSVITARKNGTYASPESYEEYVPTAPSQPSAPQAQQSWNSQPAPNPYAATSGYEASYPPQNSNAVRSNFNSQNNYSSRVDMPQLQSPGKPKETFGYGYNNGYKNTHQQQGPPSHNVNQRFGSNPSSSKLTEPLKSRPTPPVQYQQNQAHQEPPHQNGPHQNGPNQNQRFSNYGIKGGNHSGNRTNNFHEPGNEAVPGGDSWRDNTYNQPPRNDFKQGYKGDYNSEYREDFKKDFKSDFNGANKFNQQLPPRNGPSFDGNQQSNNRFPPQNGRKTLMPTPQVPFQNAPPAFSSPPQQQGNAVHPGNKPFQNGPPPVMNQQRNIPPIFPNNAAPPMQNNMNRGPPANINRLPPVPFQNPIGAQAPSVPAFNQAPVIPVINKPATVGNPLEKFYIELTRIPTDLLRPAALEAFIRPTLPLTLSSVKTVFGPGGIHMHTIIRLDSIADYATMMRRNGEQGIKITQSDKKSFDSAIDGAPIPIAVSSVITEKRDDDDSKKLKRSRWETDSPQRSPRRSPPRRNIRDRSRSRSPARRRRRSRSPRRLDEHTDPTRWCIQVTNVPFRMKEEELLEWFAEKVRPAKLVRTFYSDGNASDRWVAEFSSESLMRRSFSIRTLCVGRTLKLSYIDNEKADEILKIEDVYGEERRHKNEEARMQQEEAEKSNPPSFFNAPPISRPPISNPIQPPVMLQNPAVAPNGHNGPPLNGMNGSIAPAFNGQSQPARGGFIPRGNGFPPTARGAMMQRGGHGGNQGFHKNGGNNFNAQEPQGSFGNQGPDSFRGGYRGGFRGGRGRGGFNGAFRGEEIQPSRNEFMELVKSIGPRGTVLTCNGFPKDVTLEDVVDFFIDYEPDRNSIRIRRGEDGVMTGECMLACMSPENARRASVDLDGQKLRNSPITVRVL
ncbi:hypothetical protein CRE_24036 [Caenorhabditis remanei]|uniref:RRM domain-containing protein n=1 Tax=Caenorhabditis remanei TaxID=31234 RepID=E3MG54_CAERE|nr:hypothetical protein CRE_24036 [Caenorhabditis remanei]